MHLDGGDNGGMLMGRPVGPGIIHIRINELRIIVLISGEGRQQLLITALEIFVAAVVDVMSPEGTAVRLPPELR